jgi:hypothetical protein
MTVNAPNPGAYQQGLGAHIVAFRDALQRLINDAAYINSIGGSSGLISIGAGAISQADADLIVNTIGVVTPQNAVVQQIQAFVASTEPLWGGQ